MGIGMWRRGWSKRMGAEGLGAAVGASAGIGDEENNFRGIELAGYLPALRFF